MPRISVITCVYNFEDIVLETVHSVLNQTYQDFEFIIADDGSTDRTVEKIESVRDPRLKLIRAPHSGLPSVASNVAVAQATGELIAITGADDVWLPTRLERQAAYFAAHPEVGMLHTAYHLLIDGEVLPSDERGRDVPLGVMPAPEVTRRLLSGNFICTPSVTVRRRSVDLTDGLYNPDPRVCGPEDFDLWLRMAEAGVSFAYLEEPLVNYRIRANSVSRNRARSLAGDIVTLNTALRRSPATYAPHRSLVRRRLAYLHRELAGCKFRSGAPGAWADLRRAAGYLPWDLRTWSWAWLGMLGSSNAEKLLSIRKRVLGRQPSHVTTIQPPPPDHATQND